jgi:hypothetical protein
MDFITGALPNVMFIAGLIAIGLGLGIEFKLVEIKSELSKRGRFGAMSIGALLVATSIYLYTRPPQVPTTAAGAQPAVAQVNAGGIVVAPQQPAAQPVLVQATITPEPPTTTAMPPSVTAVPPTATPLRPTLTATPAPSATSLPPTATLMPTPTTAPSVRVPDIVGKSIKDAEKILTAAGLQLGQQRAQCEDIGVREGERRVKKGQIRCQSVATDSTAIVGQRIDYVLSGDKEDDDDD